MDLQAKPAAGAGAAAPPSRELLSQWLQALGAGLLDRDVQLRLALLAVLAGEHVLLIGPPGTAKSALARRLHRAFEAAPYFERLLTRFSTPEELFGPLSLKALEDDRYERLTTGYLPQAGIAFLDEVFKANSAILNALLTLLNERCFDNGVQRLPVPLLAVVGASNELPGDESLQAFHDRFLLRLPVPPLGEQHFAELLALQDAPAAPAPPAPLGEPARQALARAAAGVALGQDFVQGCTALRAWLAARGWPASDRRWRQFARLARVQTASEGRSAVDQLDLWLAPYVFSPQPEAVPALQEWFFEHVAQAAPAAAPWLERAVQAFEKQLEIEQRAPAEEAGGALAGDGAGKLALARAIGMVDPLQPGSGEAGSPAGGENSMPRLLSERLQAQQRRRYSPLHIAARLAQLEEIILPLLQHQAGLAHACAALQAALAPRLWLPAALGAALQGRHEAALALLQGLLQRLHAVRAGFAELPCDPGQPPAAPAPVQWAAAEA